MCRHVCKYTLSKVFLFKISEIFPVLIIIMCNTGTAADFFLMVLELYMVVYHRRHDNENGYPPFLMSTTGNS